MDKLKAIMSRVFRVPSADIGDTATMKDVAGWDSLTHIDLIVSIEQEFKVQLSGDDIADMQSVDLIRRVLERHGAI